LIIVTIWKNAFALYSRVISTLSAMLLLTSVTVYAQTPSTSSGQAYPAKSVRVIIPFPPGGGVDIVGRAMSGRLSDALNQQFIVDNRPGASGNLGTSIAARTTPDGYSLLFFPASVVSSYLLISKPGYSLEKDLDPISLVASAPNVLTVHPSLPAKNLNELIALAKAKPGQLNYGSAGIGGVPHLAAELFKLRAKVDIVHVPYKGTPAAMTDLISGQISIIIANTLSVEPHIKTGRLRALAVSSAQRSPSAPTLPTIAESGLPGFDAVTWFGMAAPVGTSPEIIARVGGEMRKIVQSKNFNDLLISQGADPIGSTADEFRARIRADLAKWAETIKAASVKAE
jgi:tripartite-type tricarboxylate transporter receptor subunit TctC